MLYALSVGFGSDPLNRKELPFVYEKGLVAVPTMATVIAWDDDPILNTGIDPKMAVHGEQSVTIHKPLPVAATVVASIRFTDIFDKGEGRGAILLIETRIRDQATGDAICTNRMTVFARGDGGFGGPSGSPPPAHRLPERAADNVVDLDTRPDQALLYALNGDRNPLHRDPDFAVEVGFPRPVLHGLCSYGIACRAILSAKLDFDTSQIKEFSCRFSAPHFPGEMLRTEIWRDGDTISFRCTVPSRGNVVVINNGRMSLAEGSAVST
jgi:acyl dehydratase